MRAAGALAEAIAAALATRPAGPPRTTSSVPGRRWAAAASGQAPGQAVVAGFLRLTGLNAEVTEGRFEDWRPPPGERFALAFAATAWDGRPRIVLAGPCLDAWCPAKGSRRQSYGPPALWRGKRWGGGRSGARRAGGTGWRDGSQNDDW
jgi:hypothetical protein